MQVPSPPPETALTEVLAVLQALDDVGCRYWLEGGWGIDALVGRQTRPHRDLDVDFDGAYEVAVLAALQGLGYVVETDWRPNRVEFIAPGRGRVDLHPLLMAPTAALSRRPSVAATTRSTAPGSPSVSLAAGQCHV